jgi:N6-adenosine-specific RNA methylase IME4
MKSRRQTAHGDLFSVAKSESKEYRCIIADPAWPERGGGKIKRGADRHYALGSYGELRDAIIQAPWRPAPNAHFWMWVTSNYLPWALRMYAEIGFRYVRDFVWVKTKSDGSGIKIGIGQYARGAHELLLCGTNAEEDSVELRSFGSSQEKCMLLLGVRGKGLAEDVWKGSRSVPSVFFAPHVRGDDGKIIHSRKPPASYELIESVSKGPRIELFARIRRVASDGETWDVWGNEAPTNETEVSREDT